MHRIRNQSGGARSQKMKNSREVISIRAILLGILAGALVRYGFGLRGGEGFAVTLLLAALFELAWRYLSTSCASNDRD